MKKGYVYSHLRLDSNTIFYIGIGSKDNFERAHSRAKRNKHWNNIVDKHGFKVEILFKDLSWEEACEKEKELIKHYGRKIDGGILCNITEGGDGAYGRKMSDKVKEILRNVNLGNKYGLGKTWKMKEETKSKMRKPKSEDHKKNISKGKLGLQLSLKEKIKRKKIAKLIGQKSKETWRRKKKIREERLEELRDKYREFL